MQSHQLLGLALLLMACGATARQRSCNSRLRILYPHLFTHCECIYSDWSSWELVPDSFVPDTTGKCDSRRVYAEKRTRSAHGHQCREEETRTMCKSLSQMNVLMCIYIFLNMFSWYLQSFCNVYSITWTSGTPKFSNHLV